jgi:hypothetical protein
MLNNINLAMAIESHQRRIANNGHWKKLSQWEYWKFLEHSTTWRLGPVINGHSKHLIALLSVARQIYSIYSFLSDNDRRSRILSSLKLTGYLLSLSLDSLLWLTIRLPDPSDHKLSWTYDKLSRRFPCPNAVYHIIDDMGSSAWQVGKVQKETTPQKSKVRK